LAFAAIARARSDEAATTASLSAHVGETGDEASEGRSTPFLPESFNPFTVASAFPTRISL
jgi:hypothetical protein